jgi:hypothetical protein
VRRWVRAVWELERVLSITPDKSFETARRCWTFRAAPSWDPHSFTARAAVLKEVEWTRGCESR